MAFANRRRIAVASSALAFLSLLPLGCSKKAPVDLGPGVDLLQAAPLQLLGQPAPLVASLSEQWGRHDGGGWFPKAVKHGDKAYVQSRWLKAKLVFSGVLPTDRTLRLKLIGPKPGKEVRKAKNREPLRVAISLNGQVLTEDFAVPTEPTELALDTKAEHWVEGDNVLMFQTNRVMYKTDKGEDGVGIGLFWATVGEERVATYDAAKRQLKLEPGTAARFAWEPAGDSTLRFVGKPPRKGSLKLDMRVRDADSMAFGESEYGGARQVAPKGDAWPSLPLPETEGGVCSFLLQYESDGDDSVTLDGAVVQGPERKPGIPIVFVSIDTLTARHLSTYGYERETSPNLDRFAQEAIVFENCRSNAPITLPSYMSQFSGVYPKPRFKGSGEVAAALRVEVAKLPDSRWTMAEALKAVGYRTAAWVDNPWLMPSNGFNQGFGTYDTGAMSLSARWDSQGGVEHVTRGSLEWLDENRGGPPYFALLQALDVHGPYVATGDFAKRFVDKPTLDEDVELPVYYKRPDTFGGIPDYIAMPLSEEERPEMLSAQKAIDAYDQVVAQMDHSVGVLFDELRERGILDEAVIVFSADHGESMLEHGYYFDHGLLYDESIHVPLIIRMPGGEGGGRRVSDLVQLVDLYPTFLELAGANIPSWLHGRSLMPLLRGEEMESIPAFTTEGVMAQATLIKDGWKLLVTRPLFGAHPSTIVSHPFFERTGMDVPRDADGKMLRNTKLKRYFSTEPGVIPTLKKAFKDTSVELFNLNEDPLELKSVAKEFPDKVAELRVEMDARLAQARAAGRDMAAAGNLGSATNKAIEKLGYTGEEEEEPADGAHPE